jgi:hypothetical protein
VDTIGRGEGGEWGEGGETRIEAYVRGRGGEKESAGPVLFSARLWTEEGEGTRCMPRKRRKEALATARQAEICRLKKALN